MHACSGLHLSDDGSFFASASADRYIHIHTYVYIYFVESIIFGGRMRQVGLYTILPSPKLYGVRHKKGESVGGGRTLRNDRAIVLQYGRFCRGGG